MPKKAAPKLRPDAAEIAFRVMQEAVGDAPKSVPPSDRPKGDRNALAVKQGQAGGMKGGKARAEKLSGADRVRIAKEAALARWEGQKPD